MQLFADHQAALLERGNEFDARSQGQNRGFGLYLAGDFDGAEQVYRRSWDALAEAGERGFRSTLGALFALALVELGRRDEAEPILDESEGLAPEDDWLTEATVEVVRARLASLDGRQDDAVAAGKRAAEISDEGYFMLRPWFSTEHGRALAPRVGMTTRGACSKKRSGCPREGLDAVRTPRPGRSGHASR